MATTTAAPDAWQGIEGKSTETTTKETTTLNTLLDTTDNRPAAAVRCDVTGCLSYVGTHDPREVPDNFVHDLAPLEGHGFDVSPVRKGAGEWHAWVELSTSERLLSSLELRDLSAALAQEAGRLDALNADGPTVTNATGWKVKPDTLLMASLCNADERATGNVGRSCYFVTAGA